MSRSAVLGLSLQLLLGLGSCCSNFMMDNQYGISVRTMDLGSGPGGLALSFGVRTYPAGVALTKGASRRCSSCVASGGQYYFTRKPPAGRD